MRCGTIVAFLLLGSLAAGAPVVAEGPDFAREIRPILNEHCLPCHGPDEGRREADLRLDERQNAFVPRAEHGPVIVPGDPEASRLYQRITASDPAERMPPEAAANPLSRDQVALLRRWIESGAKWPGHWALQPIERVSFPGGQRAAWSQNAIDEFTWKAMTAQGLKPAPTAPRAMLIRRVTLDLTGLPPTPEEIAAFVHDPSPDAYPRLVDRLLASPRYGERMALPWLDAARYADTHGYHADSHRDMWLWRAWVIDALNANMPFDAFTIEQLAGDLLPNATDRQRLATGFHRNTMLNAEEGAIPEEYLTEYVADRVETTATVWLGQTMHCARCHDHKYEPYTQRDYYRLFAYFNNVSEKGLDGRKGNAAPILWVPTPQQERQLNEAKRTASELEKKLGARRALAVAERASWESQLIEHTAAPPEDALWHAPLDEQHGDHAQSPAGQPLLKVHGEPQWISRGKFQRGLLLNGSTYLEAVEKFPQSDDGFSLSLWVFPTTQDRMRLAACGQPSGSVRRWQLFINQGHLVAQVLLDGSETPWLVASADKLAQRRWHHVLLTCGSPQSGQWVQLHLNGQPVTAGEAEQPQTLSEVVGRPLQIGAANEEGFRGLLDEVRFYGRALNTTEAGLLAGMDPIGEILRMPVEQRTRTQTSQLLNYYLEHIDQEYQTLKQQSDELDRTRREIMLSVPTTMVMDQQQPRRPTFLLERGDYQTPGEEVQPGTPEVLPPLPDNAPSNRLALARWLVDPRHPLTARVFVNRLWQLHFGTGLVATSDDFGVRGALPTHPELLDWLAAEFIASGWDVKRMQRLIVLSATYQQTSETDPASWRADPENKWLARGVRQRLPAELIRDSALATSGLLQERLGGPSVLPYQPAGLWEELAYNQDEYTAQRYRQSHGADLYRRSVYTFWKRTSPPPALVAFDAPNRERCVVRRTQSNTASQALVLMNDPTFVEAAHHVAERIMREAGPSFEERLRHGFLLIFAREPQDREVRLLRTVWENAHGKYVNNISAADQLLATGESPRDKRFDAAALAAWTIVAQILGNTDEAITRP